MRLEREIGEHGTRAHSRARLLESRLGWTSAFVARGVELVEERFGHRCDDDEGGEELVSTDVGPGFIARADSRADCGRPSK